MELRGFYQVLSKRRLHVSHIDLWEHMSAINKSKCARHGVLEKETKIKIEL